MAPGERSTATVKNINSETYLHELDTHDCEAWKLTHEGLYLPRLGWRIKCKLAEFLFRVGDYETFAIVYRPHHCSILG